MSGLGVTGELNPVRAARVGTVPAYAYVDADAITDSANGGGAPCARTIAQPDPLGLRSLTAGRWIQIGRFMMSWYAATTLLRICTAA